MTSDDIVSFMRLRGIVGDRFPCFGHKYMVPAKPPVDNRDLREPTMPVHEAAVLVLRETDNPHVMTGDEGLCHAIARRANIRARGNAWLTTKAVLRALSRRPGILVPGIVGRLDGRSVRIFYLPEHAPEGAR